MKRLAAFVIFTGGLNSPKIFAAEAQGVLLPLPLEHYADAGGASILEILRHRIASDPFNLVASIIFLLAIVHTFLATKFMHVAHKWREEHAATLPAGGEPGPAPGGVSFKAEAMHFLGEVEAIFGIWVVPLLVAATFFKGWPAAEGYISHGVVFTEPMFVAVILCIAATRPDLSVSPSKRCASSPTSGAAARRRGGFPSSRSGRCSVPSLPSLRR